MSTSNQKLILEQLLRSTHVVITTHINPDGDAMGSSLGLFHWLVSRGIKTTVLLPNAPPSNLVWMPGAESTCVWNDGNKGILESADTILVLDLNAITRLGDLGSAVIASDAFVINVDHHMQPEDFATLAWIDTGACSTSLMVTDLLVDAYGASTLSAESAQCLYTGIMTDTGSFRFPRTTSRVFRVVADLIDAGADPVRAYDQVMNQGSIGRTMLLGKTLSQMQILATGRLCVMSVSKADMLEFGCTHEDVDGFVQQTLTLKGVHMGILVVEFDNEIKVSFRSKGETFVNTLAETYGGGGHAYAAGARIPNMALNDAVNIVKTAAEATILTSH